MAVFEYGTTTTTDSSHETQAEVMPQEAVGDLLSRMTLADPDVQSVSVSDSGGNGRTNLRITIPAAIRDELGITEEYRILVRSVGEDGILLRAEGPNE